MSDSEEEIRSLLVGELASDISAISSLEQEFISEEEELVRGLAELWQEGLLCDVKLQVEGKTFPVHRAVLAAASPYWKAMFTGGFKESRNKTVQVKDMRSCALQEIISFIYTTNLNITDENVMDLFSASHITQMARVQKKCKTWMMDNIKLSTCFPYLEFAQKYEIKELENAIDLFVMANFPDVVMQEKVKFNQISHEALCHYVSSDDLRNNYNEIVVYQAVKDWVRANKNCDEKQVDEILVLIRFALIKPMELSQILYDEFVTSHKICRERVEEAFRYHMNINSQPFYEGMLNPRGSHGLFIIPNGIHEEPRSNLDVRRYNVVGDGEAPILKCFKNHDDKNIAPLGMPVVYESMTSVAIGNFLFVFGVDNRYFQNFAKRYDASMNTWIELKPVTRRPTVGTCAAQSGKEIFLLGGVSVSHTRRYDELLGGTLSNQMFRYSVEKNSWSVCTSDETETRIPNFTQASAATLDNIIYITGGLTHVGGDYVETLSSVIAYNPDTETHEMKAEMNHARCQHISHFFRGQLYVVGGRADRRETLGSRAQVEIFNTVANQWTVPRPDGLAAWSLNLSQCVRFGASVVELKNTETQKLGFYIIGGSPKYTKTILYRADGNIFTSTDIELPGTCERNICAALTIQ